MCERDHGETARTAVTLSERYTHQIMDRLPGYALYQKKKNVLYLIRKQPRSIGTINKITRGGADPGYL